MVTPTKEPVIGRLAALPTMTMPELQTMWRELNGDEPPRSSRKFIESRLAYRIQELAYGGLKPETRKRLAALVDELEAEAQVGCGGKGKRSSTGGSPTGGHTAMSKGAKRIRQNT